jgi:hypothetical protein
MALLAGRGAPARDERRSVSGRQWHVNLPQERNAAMKKEEIVAKLASGEIQPDEGLKLLAELDEKKPRGVLYCKVSQKGAISVYGLQRMPVTLYVEQWERLLNYADEIRKFAAEHDSELSRKEK